MVTAVQTQVQPILKPSNGILLRPLPDAPVPWQAVAAQKRRDRDRLLCADARATRLLRPGLTDAFPLRDRILTPLELEITSLTATELASRIADRVYTSHQVLSAYIRAATVAQDLTNCLTEICFVQGLARAKELDEHLERTGETVGPLHGVPVSIKDHIDVKGLDGASGFVGWAYHRIARVDAVIVKCLRQAGAVIYCKTSNPQSLLASVSLSVARRWLIANVQAIETNNNIYGRTLNPHNLRLGAGGSTGGEGALIAMRGSPLGVGTDIAGSIRSVLDLFHPLLGSS